MRNSPDYVNALENLPEDRKRAMLYGDWDVFEGQYFPEFRRETHVCEAFPIPDHWTRYKALDYGFDMLLSAGLPWTNRAPRICTRNTARARIWEKDTTD